MINDNLNIKEVCEPILNVTSSVYSVSSTIMTLLTHFSFGPTDIDSLETSTSTPTSTSGPACLNWLLALGAMIPGGTFE